MKNGLDNGIKPGQPTHRDKTGFNCHLRGALHRLLKVRTFTNSGSLLPPQYGYSPHHRLYNIVNDSTTTAFKLSRINCILFSHFILPLFTPLFKVVYYRAYASTAVRVYFQPFRDPESGTPVFDGDRLPHRSNPWPRQYRG